MKNISFSVLVILALCSCLFAQDFAAEFEKIKSIRLLEANRTDVKKTFKDLKSVTAGKNKRNAGPVASETFRSPFARIEVLYSEGLCTAEKGTWDVSAETVTGIEVDLTDIIKLADFAYDLSGFQKERHYADEEDYFVYHNRDLGIAFTVWEDKLDSVLFFPSRSYFSRLCDNKEAQEARDSLTGESIFGKTKLADRRLSHGDRPPLIHAIRLTETDGKELECDQPDETGKCYFSSRKISVSVLVGEPDDVVLLYKYEVSGGKIIGQGRKVIWDLQTTVPGAYTISVTVDDGCGVCADPKTEVVYIR